MGVKKNRGPSKRCAVTQEGVTSRILALNAQGVPKAFGPTSRRYSRS